MAIQKDYFNTHSVNIKKKVLFNQRNLEKGMIAEVLYVPEHGNRKLKKYIIVILNPNYKGKVHALSMEHVTVENLNRLARSTGLVYIPNIRRWRKLDLPKLIMQISSQRFYYRKLKKDIKTFYFDSYRIFFLKNFRLVNLLDYKFDDDIEQKFLLDNPNEQI